MESVAETPRLTIKKWAEDDRPREKLIKHGKAALSDAELIAILLGCGNLKETAVDLAKRILLSVENNLPELGKVGMAELVKFPGVGKAKALSIIAALELGRRRKESEFLEKKVIQNSQDAFRYMEPLLGDLPHEEFWVIYLNRSNKVIRRENVSRGGISGTVADSRLIFKSAIEALASGIIVAHNHPSGGLKPSDADLQLTRRLAQAGHMLEVPLLDHLIITDKAYYSFADQGTL